MIRKVQNIIPITDTIKKADPNTATGTIMAIPFGKVSVTDYMESRKMKGTQLHQSLCGVVQNLTLWSTLIDSNLCSSKHIGRSEVQITIYSRLCALCQLRLSSC